MKLGRNFFARDTLAVAKELLGKVLVRKVGKKIVKARITETEAYVGEEDQACHARFGRTKRNAPMYGEAGHAYVYLCYGIHELFNIVTQQKGCPEAVLIRKVELIISKNNRRNLHFEYDRTQSAYDTCGEEGTGTLGPGNLTKYLKITRELNGEDLTKSEKLWITTDGGGIKKHRIRSAERIGISYAGEWAKKKWRFCL
jgi:DNA-3-methyladenine glycosylase